LKIYIHITRCLLTLIIALISNCTINAQTCKVDSTKSIVNWQCSNKIGGHSGTIAVKEGVVKLKKGKIIRGEIVINMKEISIIDVEDEDQEKRIKKEINHPQFLNLAEYTTAKFEIKKQLNDTLMGSLTIKGNTHPFQLLVSYDMVKKKLVIDSIKTKVDLKKWGLNFTKWFNGDGLNGALSIQVHIETN
jgi:polyisoprenoid-binding protein YceI